MFCREQAVQLHRERGAIRERGGELHLIGNGSRHFAQAFAADFSIEAPLYVDTERATYSALRMTRGLSATVASFHAWKNSARALQAGFRQGRVQGDPWQNGGVLVVLPGGKVAFSHLSGSAGDHPQPADVIAALPPRRGAR